MLLYLHITILLRLWMLENQLMWPINIIDRPRLEMARQRVRSAAGHRRENLGKTRDKEGDATREPGSTSTHLIFGPSQGQCGRTIRPSLLPSSPSPRLISFLLVHASNSLCLSFSRPFSFSPCPPIDKIRTALSLHTVLGSTPSPVLSQVPFSPFFFLTRIQLTILQNSN